ncbi:AI-2E family transporter [Lactococcus garvieae]|uniref:AI-2E family transporter n=1 Tax=Lactococcus garvieae TaxID=1363 RepID=UPI003851C5FB
MYQKFIDNIQLRRTSSLLLLIGILIVLKNLLPLLLLTIIFSYITSRAVSFLKKKTKFSEKIITPLLYISVIVLIYWGVTEYIPVLVKETNRLISTITTFYQSGNKMDNNFMTMTYHFIQENNLMDKLQMGVLTLMNYATSVGTGLFFVIISFLMSFFFNLDRQETNRFSHFFLESNLSWLFKDIYYLFEKFISSVGIVIETQLIIALINTSLTILGLSILHFPDLLGLAVILFILSLIPVAGVLISCLPLSIIAYSVGGLKYVIIVLLLLVIIHALESYILNPKLMTQRTKIPLFYTFTILILSEHLFGIWGLIIGIPLFIFAIDLLQVKKI